MWYIQIVMYVASPYGAPIGLLRNSPMSVEAKTDSALHNAETCGYPGPQTEAHSSVTIKAALFLALGLVNVFRGLPQQIRLRFRGRRRSSYCPKLCRKEDLLLVLAGADERHPATPGLSRRKCGTASRYQKKSSCELQQYSSLPFWKIEDDQLKTRCSPGITCKLLGDY